MASHSVPDITSGRDRTNELPGEKPSFMAKVKTKAKKLKSKLKPGSTDSEAPSPVLRTPAEGGNDGYSSSDSSSDDEGVHRFENIPYTLMSNALQHPRDTAPTTHGNPLELASAGQGGNDSYLPDTPVVHPSTFKSAGQPGLEQAVPTSYNYFNEDPELARFPSDNNNFQRDRGVQSSVGGRMEGEAPPADQFAVGTTNPFVPHQSHRGRDHGGPTLSKLEDKEAVIPRGAFESRDFDQNIKPRDGLLQPNGEVGITREPSESRDHEGSSLSKLEDKDAVIPQGALESRDIDQKVEPKDGFLQPNEVGTSRGSFKSRRLDPEGEVRDGISQPHDLVEPKDGFLQPNEVGTPRGSFKSRHLDPESEVRDGFSQPRDLVEDSAPRDGLQPLDTPSTSMSRNVDQDKGFGFSQSSRGVRPRIPANSFSPGDGDLINDSDPASEKAHAGVDESSLNSQHGTADYGTAATGYGSPGAGYGNSATQSSATKPLHHRAYEGLAAGTVGAGALATGVEEKLGFYKQKSENNNSPRAETDTVTDRLMTGYNNTTDYGSPGADYGNPATQSSATKPLHHRAYGLAAGTVGAGAFATGVGEKLGFYKQKSENNNSPRSDTDTVTDRLTGYNNTDPAFNAAGTTLAEEPTLSQNVYNAALGTKAAKLPAEITSSNVDRSSTPATGKTWSQTAYDAAVGTKNYAAAKLPTGSNTDVGPNMGPTTSGDNVDRSSTPTGGQTWSQKAYDTAVGAKNYAAVKLPSGPNEPTGLNTLAGPTNAGTTDRSYTPAEDQTWSQKAYNAVMGTKDAPIEKQPVGTSSANLDRPYAPANEQQTWTQKVYNAAAGAKDAATAKIPFDSAAGSKNAAASKLGYADQSLSSDSTPVSQKATDSVSSTQDFAANELGDADQSFSTPVSQKATNSIYQTKDSAAAAITNPGQKPVGERLADFASELKGTAAKKAGYADQQLSSDTTPVSQKAVDSAYQAKDVAASTLAPSGGGGKPAYDIKDTAGSKLGDVDHTSPPAAHPLHPNMFDSHIAKNFDRPTSGTPIPKSSDSANPTSRGTLNPQSSGFVDRSKPLMEKMAATAAGARDYATGQINYADYALSSDETPVSHKAYEKAYQAKDVAVQKTTPDHHDKALAASITETISNLPGLLSSKLGFGGNSATSPTAGTDHERVKDAALSVPGPKHGHFYKSSGIANSEAAD